MSSSDKPQEKPSEPANTQATSESPTVEAAKKSTQPEPPPEPVFDKNLEYIMVVEDSLPNRTILVHLLRKIGYGVIECTDGQVALEQLTVAQRESLKLVAIISDIMMPRVDGIELLKKVRENPHVKDIPFVLVSAVTDRNFIMEAKKHNVAGYVVKPVTFQRVIGKLKEIFPNKEFPRIAI